MRVVVRQEFYCSTLIDIHVYYRRYLFPNFMNFEKAFYRPCIERLQMVNTIFTRMDKGPAILIVDPQNVSGGLHWGEIWPTVLIK